MHSLRQFLEEGLARRGWSQATLARESGVSKQVINGIVTDERTKLDRLPRDKTIDGLARAFEVDREVVQSVIARAMGFASLEPVTVYDPSGVADSDLLRELARRLESAQRHSANSHDGHGPSAEEYAWAARGGRPDLPPDAAPAAGVVDDGVVDDGVVDDGARDDGFLDDDGLGGEGLGDEGPGDGEPGGGVEPGGDEPATGEARR